MAFINSEGKSVSFECSQLIRELKQDITEFGGDTIVVVWCKEYEGVILYTNYDFDDGTLQKSEMHKNEFLKKMTMSALLVLMEKQNEIV